MIAVIQRCSSSSVRINNKKISEIAYGFTVLIGICTNDKEKDVEYVAKKIQTLRIFNDKNRKMNLSIKELQ